jgi:cytochrome c2
MSKSIFWRFAILALLGGMLMTAHGAIAQQAEPTCDLEAAIDHQEEHDQELAEFHHLAETDPEAALALLYRTGIAYQALAVECGFIDAAEVEALHEEEHAGTSTDEHSEHTEDEHAAAEAAERLEIARSIGDPEQGQILFNTVQPEVLFACATCHRVDTTEQLIGPGLLGIGNPSHDPSAHGDSDHDAAGEAATEEAGGHDDHHEATATPDAMAGMAGMDAAAEATPEVTTVERTLEETIAYIHTSIIDPSAYVVPNYPDDLMPKVYAEIFTEEEINNLVAYLLTL